MINIKRIALAIVVIVVIVAAGFLVLKFHNGSSEGAATGKLTEVPENKNETITAPVKIIDPNTIEGITEGVSMNKVTDLLGEPTEKQTVTTPKGNTIEYWYYTDKNNAVWQIGFSDDVVSVVRKF